MERSITNSRPRKTIVALTALLLSSFLGDCTTEAPLSRDELVEIHEGRSAVILLRFVGQDQHGESLEPFPGRSPLVLGGLEQAAERRANIQLEIGDFNSGGVPKDVSFGSLSYRFLSKEARTEDWIALIRPPGYYYLTVREPLGNPIWISSPELAPRWRIEVPAGTAVVYAGTFRLSGTIRWTLFGRGTLIELDQTATQVEDESGAAAQEARRDLPSLPPPLTRLAVLHSGPILLGVPPPAH